MQPGARTSIDLNADLGEGMGDDAAMLGVVTSANVACGGHAGDPETMFRTLVLARERGIAIGAHPSYPDREGFGRRRLPYPPDQVKRFVAAQIGALIAVGRLAGHPVRYVKPHGALANVASEEAEIAAAIVRAVRAVDPGLAILAISGTMLERVARDAGARAFSEVFADRGYTAAGNLVPRDRPGAMIEDAEIAAARLTGFLDDRVMPTVDGGGVRLAADSICVHGDSEGAVAMASRIREVLAACGVALAPFVPTA